MSATNQLHDKLIVITGASDGIGAQAARELHSMGGHVVIVGRSPEKTRQIATELEVPYFIADFAKLDDVRLLAQELKKTYPRIDVLVNNAGGIFGNRELTVDGHERIMQINYLAPFLLTNLLLDTLLKSKATVISTSSIANQLFGHLDMADIELEKGYSANKAYGNAKLANILFIKELHNRYHDKGLNAASFYPGNVATNFASNTTSWLKFIFHSFLRQYVLLSPAQGADTLLWLILSEPGKDWQSGEYYAKRKIIKANKQAYDRNLAKALWEVSDAMTKT